jgi:preprotein translocase subunit YajC
VEQLFPFILLIFALIVVVVLPARQRKNMQAKAAAMQAQLTVGTPVMLTSGMHGTVAGLGDGTVDVEIAPGVVATFARAAIMEVRRPAGTDVAPTEGTDGSTGSTGSTGATGFVDGDGDPTDRTR